MVSGNEEAGEPVGEPAGSGIWKKYMTICRVWITVDGRYILCVCINNSRSQRQEVRKDARGPKYSADTSCIVLYSLQ